MKKKFSLLVFTLLIGLSAFRADPPLQLSNSRLRLSWQNSPNGWSINSIEMNGKGKWQSVGRPSGEYTLLYSAEKPDTVPAENFKTITGDDFPDPVYKYQVSKWKQSILPVPMNTAGKAYEFYPQSAHAEGKNKLVFEQETDVASISSEWMFDPAFPSDILVTQTFKTKKAGYFSLASPSLLNIDEKEMRWATVPGYFQGNEVQNNFVLAYAYGQGVPAKPVIYRERSASSLCPIVSVKNGITISAMPEPLLAGIPGPMIKTPTRTGL